MLTPQYYGVVASELTRRTSTYIPMTDNMYTNWNIAGDFEGRKGTNRRARSWTRGRWMDAAVVQPGGEGIHHLAWQCPR